MSGTFQVDNITNTAGTGPVNFPYGYSGAVSLYYSGLTSPSTFTGTPTVCVFTTQSYDTNSAYNNSTGVFTAPLTGQYQIVVSVYSTDSVATDIVTFGLYKNGAPGTGTLIVASAISTSNNASPITFVVVSPGVKLNSGDTIAPYISAGHSNTTTTTAAYNFISILKVG